MTDSDMINAITTLVVKATGLVQAIKSLVKLMTATRSRKMGKREDGDA